jgi:O-succinylbenzoate synthase
MDYSFVFWQYRRPFRQLLHTAHGKWSVREGIIVQLTNDQSQSTLGEIAPLPWFGSETLAQAQAFCIGLGKKITEEAIAQIPDRLPACQFAFGCALEKFESVSDRRVKEDFDYSVLLPNRSDALDFLRQSHEIASTYKWKIGIDSIASEMAIFKEILKLLPQSAKLRLDANGGLSLDEAKQWLELADCSDRVEFIEQLIDPRLIEETFALRRNYKTPIALDEAIASLSELQAWFDLGWQGVYTIKAAILGYPHRLRDFCQDKALDLVFSSVFETEIGCRDVLNLAAELGNRDRALGFGVKHWFGSEAP